MEILEEWGGEMEEGRSHGDGRARGRTFFVPSD